MRRTSLFRFNRLAIAVSLGLAGPVLADDQPGSKVLERIMVVGDEEQRSEIAGSAHYIGKKELEKHEYSNINRILREIPGVNVQEDGLGLRPSIGIRGTGLDRSQKITLMEDGVLIAPAPYSAPAAYYFPMAGRMEAVEVRKGSSTIKYGPNTTGGAINLISTSIPNSVLGGKADINIGNFSRREIHANAGGAQDNFGWLLETYQIGTTGFKDLDGGGETGINVKDALAKFRLNSAPDAALYQELELKLSGTDELSNVTYLGLTDSDFAATPYRRYAGSQQDQMDAQHGQLQLRHYMQPSAKVDVITTVYRNEYSRNWYKLGKVGGVSINKILEDSATYAAEYAVIAGADSPDDYLSVKANNRVYLAQGIQSAINFELGGENLSHDLEVGVRYHEDEEDRFQWSDKYKMDNGTMVMTSAGTPGGSASNNRVKSAQAWALYVQDKISFGNWVLTPGLRYETINTREVRWSDPGRGTVAKDASNTLNVVMPGVGAVYKLNPKLSLLAGAHKGFTPSSPGSTAVSEQSVNYEFGARYQTSALRTEAIGFFNNYSNLLGSCTASAGANCEQGDQFNGGKSKVLGLEASLAYDLGVARNLDFAIPLRLAYTYTDATFQSSFESNYDPWGSVEKGDEIPYIASNQLSAGIGVEKATWDVDLTAKYVGDTRTYAGKGAIPTAERLDSRVVFDLAGNYKLGDKSKVFLAIENLTNEIYMAARRPAGALPGAPRNVRIGIKMDL